MDNLKFYISSSSVAMSQVWPRRKSSQFKYTRDGVYYDFQFEEDLLFNAAEDYDTLIGLENSPCEEITLSVHKQGEDGDFTEFWSGSFTMFDAKHDATGCTFKLKAERQTLYDCVNDTTAAEVNTFTGAEVISYASAGLYEHKTCTAFFDEGDGDTEPTLPAFGCLPFPVANWCVYFDEVVEDTYMTYDPVDGYPDGERRTWDQTSKFHREIVDSTCEDGQPVEPSYGGSWQLVESDCGSNYSKWYRCPSVAENLAGDYPNGRTLEQFLTNAFSGLGCAFSLKSDFFNINPENDSPDNSYYRYAEDYLHHLIVHQKSDVKRKDAANASTEESWDLKVKELIADLYTIFRVVLDVQDSTVILEHESFFSYVDGLDLTARKINIQYDSSGNENIGKVLYYWPDDDGERSVFKFSPVFYDCGDDETEKRINLFSTDLLYIEDEDNGDAVNDKGFVLVSTALFNGKNVILDNNDPLKGSNLHANLHSFSGFFPTGRINGVSLEFEEVKPYRKLDQFSIVLDESETFDPSDRVLLNIKGATQRAEVTEAVLDVGTSKLTLDLKF